MMVVFDKPRQPHIPGEIKPFTHTLGKFGIFSNRLDHVITDQQCTVGNFAALVIHRGEDMGMFDQKGRHVYLTLSPKAISAALSVFSSSMAIVIGPTPPGTGVIAPATSFADSKSTSPTVRDPLFLVGSSMLFVPTSITTAPGLIQSPFTICARPTAATRISA